MKLTKFLRNTIAASIIAAGLGASGAYAQHDKLTVALIPGLTTDGFYISMRRGAQLAADAIGAELIWQGAAEWNTSLQVPVVEAMIARRPHVILIAPNDKDQLIEPLRRAHNAGIKVVTVDTHIGNGIYQTGSGAADFPFAHISSDNAAGGRIGCEALAKAIGFQGKVYVSSLKPGVSTLDAREAGCKEALVNYPDIEVLETQYHDQDENKAAAQFQAIYGRTPDLAGVFAANTVGALGTANGLKQAGLLGKIKVAGFDSPPSIEGYLKDGTLEMTVAQHPAEIGYYGVMTAYALTHGQSVPPAIGTGGTLMTGDNIDDPEIKKFLYTAD